jgi:D-isomer specific 2-hydroxyacid dehydrogenase family protein
VLGSVGIVTAFNPHIGYEKSASIAKEALATGKAVGDICLERGYLSKEQIDKILEPKNMLNPAMDTTEIGK